MVLSLREKDAAVVPLLMIVVLLAFNALAPAGRPRSQRNANAPDPWVRMLHAQDVPARMWEDPLGAVRAEGKARWEAERPRGSDGKPAELSFDALKEANKRVLNDLRAEMAGDGPPPLIIPILARGGPYPEDKEYRTRSRYAVTSALHVAGYKPISGDSVGLLSCPRLESPQDGATRSTFDPTPAYIAFSRYERRSNATVERIIVLWMSDADFPGSDADAGLAHALHTLSYALPKGHVQVAPIGPFSSDELLSLVAKTPVGKTEGQVPPTRLICVGDVRFVLRPWKSVTATIPESDVREHLNQMRPRSELSSPWPNIEEQIRRVERGTPDDAMIARALAKELARRRGPRRLPATENVALVYEADTSFARSLQAAMRKAIREENAMARPGLDFTYLRGIDGLLVQRPETDTAGATVQRVPSAGDVIRPYMRPRERSNAIGTDQMDYLDRLVDSIKLRERVAGVPITAIGLLGTDYYDKDLLLQALRPAFPGVVFFTTDVDARLLDPRCTPHTRNLIVGAGFGLSLGETLQGSVPPFRDSFQTALFAAVRQAIARAEGQEISIKHTPLVLEIGRTRPHLLSPAAALGGALWPDEPHGWPVRSITGAGVVLGLLVLLAGFVSSWLGRAMRAATEGPRETRAWKGWRQALRDVAWRAGLIGMGLCLTLLVWAVLPRIQPVEAGGEPSGWPYGDGVNGWPTITILIITLVYALAWIWAFTARWQQGAADLARTYGLPPTRHKTAQGWTTLEWQVKDRTPEAHKTWKEYLHFGQPHLRVLRTAIFAVGYWVMGMLLWRVILDNPPPPLRGGFAQFLHTMVVQVAAVAIAFLVFYVWDATRLCEAFVQHLGSGQTRYRPRVLRRFAGAHNFEANDEKELEDIGSLIDVRIIGERTALIGSAIYPPTLALFLMLAARHPLIDNWKWSPALVVTTGILFVILVMSAWILRFTATRVRDKELRRLRERRSTLPDGLARKRQLDRIIQEIEQYRVGAFAGFASHPVINALLIPVLGAVGLGIIQKLASV